MSTDTYLDFMTDIETPSSRRGRRLLYELGNRDSLDRYSLWLSDFHSDYQPKRYRAKTEMFYLQVPTDSVD
jgi:hypothetical protein